MPRRGRFGPHTRRWGHELTGPVPIRSRPWWAGLCGVRHRRARAVAGPGLGAAPTISRARSEVRCGVWRVGSVRRGGGAEPGAVIFVGAVCCPPHPPLSPTPSPLPTMALAMRSTLALRPARVRRGESVPRAARRGDGCAAARPNRGPAGRGRQQPDRGGRRAGKMRGRGGAARARAGGSARPAADPATPLVSSPPPRP